jgi:3-methyladenine DNA glycosylase AlkD
MRRWARDPHLWKRRASLICQLKRRDRLDTALLTDCIDANLEDRDFFIRKAIGWALRQHAKQDPAWVRAFVEARGERLSGLSRREAMKHLG